MVWQAWCGLAPYGEVNLGMAGMVSFGMPCQGEARPRKEAIVMSMDRLRTVLGIATILVVFSAVGLLPFSDFSMGLIKMVYRVAKSFFGQFD